MQMLGLIVGGILHFAPFESSFSANHSGKSSIPIDHIVTGLRSIPYFEVVYAGLIVVVGAILPFVRKTWNKDAVTTIFSIFKVIGIGVVGMAIFGWGPESFHTPDMLPFVFNKVVIPVTILVPVGAVFLSFLINYGLMEFIGVFMKPVMRPIWKTPGRSAVDAVASFVGSYSVGLLITNRVYKEGFYSEKEASIIATGFSTVSATFMIVVAKTLGLMDHWNLYFWTTLIITFVVTAITTRIYPLCKKSDKGYNNMEVTPEPKVEKGKLVSTAFDEGLHACSRAPKFVDGLVKNFVDGLNMALNIGPTLMAIGFLAEIHIGNPQWYHVLRSELFNSFVILGSIIVSSVNYLIKIINHINRLPSFYSISSSVSIHNVNFSRFRNRKVTVRTMPLLGMV